MPPPYFVYPLVSLTLAYVPQVIVVFRVRYPWKCAYNHFKRSNGSVAVKKLRFRCCEAARFVLSFQRSGKAATFASKLHLQCFYVIFSTTQRNRQSSEAAMSLAFVSASLLNVINLRRYPLWWMSRKTARSGFQILLKWRRGQLAMLIVEFFRVIFGEVAERQRCVVLFRSDKAARFTLQVYFTSFYCNNHHCQQFQKQRSCVIALAMIRWCVDVI